MQNGASRVLAGPAPAPDDGNSSRRLALAQLENDGGASDTASLAKRTDSDDDGHARMSTASTTSRFLLSNELGRGAFTGLEEVLHYLLMLVVMCVQLMLPAYFWH